MKSGKWFAEKNPKKLRAILWTGSNVDAVLAFHPDIYITKSGGLRIKDNYFGEKEDIQAPAYIVDTPRKKFDILQILEKETFDRRWVEVKV